MDELVKHGQLSSALKGLTEGESKVPTAHALRSKFKTKNWITVQVMGGPASGDLLLGDLGLVLAWLAGRNKSLIYRPNVLINLFSSLFYQNIVYKMLWVKIEEFGYFLFCFKKYILSLHL